MHDRFRKRLKASDGTPRLRRQIAVEAARRLISARSGDDAPASNWLDRLTEAELYTAKRKAAAVLGHRIRPGDLPADSEVREEILRFRGPGDAPSGPDDPDDGEAVDALADHVDRFVIYRLRLTPLENAKQNPRTHPEGDALYHSLQVFELAREARPYDEEFLLAALLHDVGKAIDPQDHVAAGLNALRGAVSERVLWLIEHHMDLAPHRDRPIGSALRRSLETSEYFEDLKLLRELDDAGRVPGTPVGTVDEALEYLRALDEEQYLDD